MINYYAQLNNRRQEITEELVECHSENIAEETHVPERSATFNHQEWLLAEQQSVTNAITRMEQIITLAGNVAYDSDSSTEREDNT